MGEVMHNDDTNMRVPKMERPPADQRTGVLTSGVVSVGAAIVIEYSKCSRHCAAD